MGLTDRLATKPPPGPALRAVMGLHAGLRRAREAMFPPHAVIVVRTLEVVSIRALGVAAELDLARLVGEQPRTAAELAAATGTDADALDRLLELLASTGCFRRDRDGRWHNTRLSASLREDGEYPMRGWARFFGGAKFFRVMAEADHAVATGESATRAATGMEFFDWAHTGDPDFGARFDAAMRDGAAGVARSFTAVVDLDGVRTICDVGGGTGTLLAAVLAERPEMRGILFDLPEVVDRGRAVLEAAGVADRVDVVGGSFFESVPTADRIVLVSIVHDWGDARATDILRTCRAALPEGGKILLVEPQRDPDHPGLLDRQTDVLMQWLTGAGRERSRAEHEALWDAAGLHCTRTWLLASMQTVFELTPV